MGPPDQTPIGLLVSRTARTVAREFAAALAEAGGTEPVWLILLSLRRDPTSTQRQIATDLGIREATLTHHLAAMERDGLITRRRDPSNRRVHIVTLTEDGEQSFHRLRRAAGAFDARLRDGIEPQALDQMRGALEKLARNAES